MRKTNRNSLTKTVALMLLITMIALVLISGTFAKYTSSVTASDSAVVAKWDVEVNGTNIAPTDHEEVTFDIFDKSGVFDLDGASFPMETVAGTNDTDVKDGAETAIVAPGTWGFVKFELENKSDVNALYSIDLTELSTTLPLQFSVDGGNTWKAAIGDSAISASAETPYSVGTGKLVSVQNEKAEGDSSTASKTVYLMWKWDFEDSITTDAEDTAFGVAGATDSAPTCDVTAKVVFTQID